MKFYPTHGKIGPVFKPVGVRFQKTANPYVMTNWQGPTLQVPSATTATVAGRAAIGCCGGCAKDHRNSS